MQDARGLSSRFPHAPIRRNDEGGGRSSVNHTSRATLGLRALYASIADGYKHSSPWLTDRNADDVARGMPYATATRTRGMGSGDLIPMINMDEGGSLSDSTGRLIVSNTLPLMGRRYQCEETIGEGTFSRIVRAKDTFIDDKKVAIKVMNLSYAAIGQREARCVRHLNAVRYSEFCPVVSLKNTFVFHGHFCLVMDLLEAPLLLFTLRQAGGQEPAGSDPVSQRGASECIGDQRHGTGLRLNRKKSRLDLHLDVPPSIHGDAGMGASGRGNGDPMTFFGDGLLSKRARSRDGAEMGRVSNPNTSVRQKTEVPIHVIRHVALQLVGALCLLGNHGIVHADIKPENILLRSDGLAPAIHLEEMMSGRLGGCFSACSPPELKVKLCDFGNAIHTSEASLYFDNFDIQTLAYRAPEVLMGCPFGPPIDVWSVGVVLLELVLGRPLFHTAGTRRALLCQTLCAFGPLPLRRFRSGRFFSEYFAEDHSLKIDVEGSPPNPGCFGCCPCCWLGDGVTHTGARTCNWQASVWKGGCSQCCSQTCSKLGQLKREKVQRSTTCILQQGSEGRAVVGREVKPIEGGSFCAPMDETVHSVHLAHDRLRRLLGSALVDVPLNQRNPYLLDLLAGLLKLDPDDRLTPHQALMHPFFGEAFPFAATLGVHISAGLGGDVTSLQTQPQIQSLTPVSVATTARFAHAGAAVPMPRGLPSELPVPGKSRQAAHQGMLKGLRIRSPWSNTNLGGGGDQNSKYILKNNDAVQEDNACQQSGPEFECAQTHTPTPWVRCLQSHHPLVPETSTMEAGFASNIPAPVPDLDNTCKTSPAFDQPANPKVVPGKKKHKEREPFADRLTLLRRNRFLSPALLARMRPRFVSKGASDEPLTEKEDPVPPRSWERGHDAADLRAEPTACRLAANTNQPNDEGGVSGSRNRGNKSEDCPRQAAPLLDLLRRNRFLSPELLARIKPEVAVDDVTEPATVAAVTSSIAGEFEESATQPSISKSSNAYTGFSAWGRSRHLQRQRGASPPCEETVESSDESLNNEVDGCTNLSSRAPKRGRDVAPSLQRNYMEHRKPKMVAGVVTSM